MPRNPGVKTVCFHCTGNGLETCESRTSSIFECLHLRMSRYESNMSRYELNMRVWFEVRVLIRSWRVYDSVKPNALHSYRNAPSPSNIVTSFLFLDLTCLGTTLSSHRKYPDIQGYLVTSQEIHHVSCCPLSSWLGLFFQTLQPTPMRDYLMFYVSRAPYTSGSASSPSKIS